MSDYQRFIEAKTLIDSPTGFSPGDINPALFPWQAEIVRYACMRGRFGGYEDCGLGKSIQQLESARLINEHTGLPVIIFAPLAVAEQTKREAHKFNIQSEVRVCKDQSHIGNCINVANYERLHLFDPSQFGGVLLDEGVSSKVSTARLAEHCSITGSASRIGNHGQRLLRRTTLWRSVIRLSFSES